MRPTEHDKIETKRRNPRLARCVACLAAGCLTVIGSAAWAETRITPTFSIDGTFTDNVRSSVKGTEEGDLFTTVQPGVRVNNTGGRTQLNLAYGLSADRYLDATDLNEERHNLTGLGSVDIIRDQLTVDARTSLSRLVVNRGGAVSAVDRNIGSNQTDTLVYSLSPSYRTNISNWALSSLQYTFSQTVFDPFGNQPSGASASQDATSNQVSYQLSSGRAFSRFGWTASSNYQRSAQEAGSTTNSATASLAVNYDYSRYFQPSASVGYNRFRGGGEGNNTSGNTWSIGARLIPGPRLSANVEYGRNFDDNHIQGSATFRVTPTITINASAVHQFSVVQSQIAAGLQSLNVDQDGNFIDDNTGLPFTPTTQGSDLSEVNNVTRTQTYTLALSGTRGRNNYGMSTSVQEQTNNISGRKTTTLSSSGNLSRRLSPETTANLSASISGTEDNSSSNTQTGTVQAGLSYRLGANVSGSANYTFLQSNSSAAGGDRRENTITARLQITF